MLFCYFRGVMFWYILTFPATERGIVNKQLCEGENYELRSIMALHIAWRVDACLVFYRFHFHITDEICDMILRKKAFTFEAPSRETYLLIYQSLIDSKQYLSIYIKWDASWGKEIVNFLVSKSCISMTSNVPQPWFSEKWMSARWSLEKNLISWWKGRRRKTCKASVWET